MRKQLSVGCLVLSVALLGFIPLTMEVHAQAKALMTMTKVSGPYKLELIIGPAETMSVSMKSTAAERMICGKLASCSMPMLVSVLVQTEKIKTQMCNHHVEIHVYINKTGKVVPNAKVAIAPQGQGMRGSTTLIAVPIMRMEGMRAGPSDFHYGNNICARVKATLGISLGGSV